MRKNKAKNLIVKSVNKQLTIKMDHKLVDAKLHSKKEKELKASGSQEIVLKIDK